MPRKTTSIPVENFFADEDKSGISVEKLLIDDLDLFGDVLKAHRHNGHTFLLLETGTVSVEIDFEKHRITAPSVVYMHPDQVHVLISGHNMTIISIAVTDEQLRAQYLGMLGCMRPAKPLALDEDAYAVLSEATALCLRLSEKKQRMLYQPVLRDSCNAVAALFIAQYMEQTGFTGRRSRAESVAAAFRELLERDYTRSRRPADYARELNISAAYLNECVRKATGYPVSHQIQQRVVLEAKRLLRHTDRSVKEIAVALGCDDYRYFSRLFARVAGMPPLTFRSRNPG